MSKNNLKLGLKSLKVNYADTQVGRLAMTSAFRNTNTPCVRETAE